jgi:hypothetical protein
MKSKNKELRDKIVLGVKLAVSKLIERKRESDGELVYSKDGKVVRIRARDIQE